MTPLLTSRDLAAASQYVLQVARTQFEFWKLRWICTNWRDQTNFGIKTLIGVVAATLLMLLVKLLGIGLVELPGLKITGAPHKRRPR